VQKNILALGQTLESKAVYPTQVTLDGILTGPNAYDVMKQLEKAWKYCTLANLITPTYPSPGEAAVITELQFSVEQMKFYERKINFEITFLLVPSVVDPATQGIGPPIPVLMYPTYQVLVETSTPGIYAEPVGVISIEVDRLFGGQASSFDIIFDNVNGQNAYPILDYWRNVKVYLGYNGVNVLRIWGLIDTLDYTSTKDEGSQVEMSGRDYMARFAEGTNFDHTYVDMLPNDMMVDICERANMSTVGLESPNWMYWGYSPWPSFIPFSNSTLLEAIDKISSLYKMLYWMDSGEFFGSPTLHWQDQPRLSALTQDCEASEMIYVQDPVLFRNWVNPNGGGETLYLCGGRKWISTPGPPGSGYWSDPVYSEPVKSTSADLVSGAIDWWHDHSLSYIYNVADGAVLSTVVVQPKIKYYGYNISELDLRLTGTGLRTKCAVFGDGVYSIADTETPFLIPSGNDNPTYLPGLQAKYGRKQDIITDDTLETPIYCEVLAYSTLFTEMLPEKEFRVTVEGDPNLKPEYIIPLKFTDYNPSMEPTTLSGMAGTYFLTEVIDRFDQNGYLSECVLRKFTQVMSPTLLSGVFKNTAKGITGAQTLLARKAMFPILGSVIEPGVPQAIWNVGDRVQYIPTGAVGTVQNINYAIPTYQVLLDNGVTLPYMVGDYFQAAP
jgi:hypothetical protein